QPENPDGSTNDGPLFSLLPPLNVWSGFTGGWYSTPTNDINEIPSTFQGHKIRYGWAVQGQPNTTVRNPVITTTPPGGGISNEDDNLPLGVSASGGSCTIDRASA